MEARQISRLEHLKSAVPKEAFGYLMTIYLIGLEAWRRGLEVSFVNTDVENHDYQLIISNKNKRIRFSGSRSNLVDKEIINFCSNKYKTREFLKKNDVPVLNCHLIQKDTTELEIEQCAEDIGYPLTVKPNNGNGGEGVILNLKNKEELLSAITRAKNASGESKILLEKYIPKGKDIQVYIVDGKIVAAYERVPAHVVGNGKRSIKRLISKKNRRRKNNPGLAHYPINNIKLIEQNIEQEDHTLESVLEKDESVILKGKSNINLGGEPHDILDYLPQEVDQFVETLKQNTDKLPAFSFEFIQDAVTGDLYAMEIKTKPAITNFVYPALGESRDVPKAIIDYYFSETNENKKQDKYYFDISNMKYLFSSNQMQEYKLPRIPRESDEPISFIVYGINHRQKYINELKPKLVNLGLNGFFRYGKNKRLRIVLIGEESNIEKAAKVLEIKDTDLIDKKFKIKKAKWKKPVKVGFEVIYPKENTKSKKKKQEEKGIKSILTMLSKKSN